MQLPPEIETDVWEEVVDCLEPEEVTVKDNGYVVGVRWRFRGDLEGGVDSGAGFRIAHGAPRWLRVANVEGSPRPWLQIAHRWHVDFLHAAIAEKVWGAVDDGQKASSRDGMPTLRQKYRSGSHLFARSNVRFRSLRFGIGGKVRDFSKVTTVSEWPLHCQGLGLMMSGMDPWASRIQKRNALT